MTSHSKLTKWQSSDYRFDSRVSEHESGCHLWVGHVTSSGYGELYVNGVKTPAHRFSYQRRYGPIPDGLIVRHKCDVPACTNPDHLELGTQRDNIQDMVKRGRMRSSCLSSTDVLRIRKLSIFGLPATEIAQMLGLGTSAVHRASTGSTYQHLPYPTPHGEIFVRRPSRVRKKEFALTFNARKTHCKRGHPFDDQNTVIDGRGDRRCAECARTAYRTAVLEGEA